MNLPQQLSEAKGLFLVYGKAGTGKTTFLMELLHHTKGKAFIIDSENGFSIDRFKQISGNDVELDGLFVTKPVDFEDQTKLISNVLENEELFDFIGLDTIGKFYRQASKISRSKANNELARQMRILKEISRKKPVVVCNQVYQNINENKVEPLGRSFVTKWCDHIIFLDEENEMRTMKVSDKDNVNFVIGEKGFIFES
ncbi:AAA family ATPase [Candidatus Woesearchaeota archaeon]|nr:AAA family ATPase [Candidatus Woesearchaeota archaeon]